MLYKVGDEVVLKETWGKFSILEVDSDISGYLLDAFGWINEKDIDHEKTAELNDSECMSKFLYGDTLEEMTPEVSKWADEEEVLEQRTGELEKIVAEKNKREAKNVDDAVKPAHYRQGNIDRIEVWYQTYPFEGFRWAMKSHIDKYIHRYESKGGVEDLDKATYFIKRLKEKENEHE